ncbi:MAG: MlaD family protein [Rhodothermales bacterium]
MKFSNEIKVGIALVVAVIIFFVGVRYLQDIPLFKGTHQYTTSFEDAGGLLEGNAVRINGVNVGAVDRVELRSGPNAAHVVFHVQKETVIPQGSTASVGGMALLGVVRLDIQLGPANNPALEEGDHVPGSSEDGLGNLIDRAPAFADRADSLFMDVSTTLDEARLMLANPQSNLQQTLVAIQGTANTLNNLLRSEQERLARVLDGVATLTDNLNGFTGENGDSLRATVQHVNQVLLRLDESLASLASTTVRFDTIMARIERGDGTLGLLINDPSLYHQLDSTLTNLNRILLDFEQNPKRYLKDLKLIDVL